MSRRESLLREYVRDNVFCRCGKAVSRLVESGLLERPVLPDSETEVHEWWLVSPLAARALRESGEPVLQFCELYLWGRTHAPGAVQNDPALAEAAQPQEPPAPTGW